MIEEWRRIYCLVARHNGAEPDVGRHLLGWFHQASIKDVHTSASAWAYSSGPGVAAEYRSQEQLWVSV